MKIRQLFINRNFSGRNGETIKYIVIHDTGNSKPGATAYAHYKYFSGDSRAASAHYFVDDNEVIQIVRDIDSAWHVGDGRGAYGITNANSIGIEICVNYDGNYEKAVANTVELTKELMKKHNIPLDRVVRHYDASRKLCPNSMRANAWAKWEDFKKALVDPEGIKVRIGQKSYVMDGVFQNDKNYVSVRELAEALGHEVLWDKATQTVVIR